MEQALLQQDLEALATVLAIEIRYEELEDGRGGLCRCRDRSYLILDRRLSVPERVRRLSRELARVGLEDVFVPPRLRELLEVASRAYRAPVP
jgi:hypothetical protein